MTWNRDITSEALAVMDNIHEDAFACGVLIPSDLRWRIVGLIADGMQKAVEVQRNISDMEEMVTKYADRSTDGLPAVTLTDGVPGVRVNGKDPNVQTPEAEAAAFVMPYLQADPAPTPVTTVFEPTPVVMNPQFAPAPPVPMNQPSNAEKVEAAEAFKRGRGRPKGAKNKKRKAKAAVAKALAPDAAP